MMEFGIFRQLTLFCHRGPSQQDSEKSTGARVQSFNVGPGASLLESGDTVVSYTKKRLFLNLTIAWNLFVSGLHNSVPGPGKLFLGHRLEIFLLIFFQALGGNFPLLIIWIPALGCFHSASLEVSNPTRSWPLHPHD
jgi:hypothetical protein